METFYGRHTALTPAIVKRNRLMAMITLTKLKTARCKVFYATRASFGQLGIISDPHINFQKSRSGLNDHKGTENINGTIVKQDETFLLPPIATNTSCNSVSSKTDIGAMYSEDQKKNFLMYMSLTKSLQMTCAQVTSITMYIHMSRNRIKSGFVLCWLCP